MQFETESVIEPFKASRLLSPDLFSGEKSGIALIMADGYKVYQLDLALDPGASMKWLKADIILNKISKIGKPLKVFPETAQFLLPDFDGSFSVLLGSKDDEARLKEGIVGHVSEVRIVEYRERCVNTLIDMKR